MADDAAQEAAVVHRQGARERDFLGVADERGRDAHAADDGLAQVLQEWAVDLGRAAHVEGLNLNRALAVVRRHVEVVELADLVDRGRDVLQVRELDLALLDRPDEVLDRVVAVVVDADVDVPHQPLGATDGVAHERVGHGSQVQLGQELDAGQHGLAVGRGTVRREVHHLVGRDVREGGAALLAAGTRQDRVRVGGKLLVVLQVLRGSQLGGQGLRDDAADQRVLALRGDHVAGAHGADGQVLVDGADQGSLVHRAAAGEVGDVRAGQLDVVVAEQGVVLVQLDHVLRWDHLHDGAADLGAGQADVLPVPALLGALAAATRQVLREGHRHGALGGDVGGVLADHHQVVEVFGEVLAQVAVVDSLAFLALGLDHLNQGLHVLVVGGGDVLGLDQRRPVRRDGAGGLVEDAFQLLTEVQDGHEVVALDQRLDDGLFALVVDVVLLDQLLALGPDGGQGFLIRVLAVVVDGDVALREVVRRHDVVAVRLHGLAGLSDQVGDLREGLVIVEAALLGGEELVDHRGVDLVERVLQRLAAVLHLDAGVLLAFLDERGLQQGVLLQTGHRLQRVTAGQAGLGGADAPGDRADDGVEVRAAPELGLLAPGEHLLRLAGGALGAVQGGLGSILTAAFVDAAATVGAVAVVVSHVSFLFGPAVRPAGKCR